MDIRHYFNAVNFQKFSNLEQNNWKHSLGEVIEKNTNLLTPEKFQKLDIAVIGVPFDSSKTEHIDDETTKAIRKELYALSKFENTFHIADFGDLKKASSLKGNYTALRDIVEFFKELGVTLLILGGSQDLTCGISEAFKHDAYFSLSLIDALLDIKRGNEQFNTGNYLSRIYRSQPNLFQSNLLAYQRHYVPDNLLMKLKGINVNVSLGQIRQNIKGIEPVLRNSDVVSFDIGSIKHVEAPGTSNVFPNGLRSEEACQLAKYAGLSSRTKVFGLFGVDSKKEKVLTPKIAAQIGWYFIEGVVNRHDDNPTNTEGNTIYKVEIENLDNPITFVQNKVTGRWWMQLTTLTNEPVYFACSANEYIQAGNNEIPEIWMKYMQKLDELLK